MTRDLLSRVAHLERQLSMLSTTALGALPPAGHSRIEHQSPTSSTEDRVTPDSAVLQSVLESDGQTFVGEASITPALDAMPETTSATVPSTSSPNTMMQRSNDAPLKVPGWLQLIFSQHDLIAEPSRWRRCLHNFFNEIHVLYPFLHPPSVWESFDALWEPSTLWVPSDMAEAKQKRASVALVCFCLALGRCSISTRMEDEDGVHSSGWTLYSAGMSLIQDSPELSDGSAMSLMGFQITITRVSRLDHLMISGSLTCLHATRSCTFFA